MLDRLNYLVSLYGHADFFAYLESPAWKDFCKSNIKKSCDKCGDKNNLGVHFKNYGSVCLERPKDVETLCSTCSIKSKTVRPV